jgi:hypothetical protein
MRSAETTAATNEIFNTHVDARIERANWARGGERGGGALGACNVGVLRRGTRARSASRPELGR